MGRVADPSTVVTRRLRKISLAKGTILLKNLNKNLAIRLWHDFELQNRPFVILNLLSFSHILCETTAPARS
jgi:hypothetical protein